MPSLSTIGETSVLQARIDPRGPGAARAGYARAGFRSGTPGRRAQDALAQESNARARAPIFDLRATNRQAPRSPQPLETGRAAGTANIHGAVEPAAGTIAAPASARSLNPGGSGERNPLRRLSVNDAYLSAETLDGPYAMRGSIFDMQI